MASFEYNPLADQINLKFKCPNCGAQVEDTVGVPTPNLLTEAHHDSMNYDTVDIICEHCGHEINIDLQTGYYGGFVEIEGVEDCMVEVHEYITGEDEEYFEQHLYEESHTDIEKALDAIDKLNDDVKQFFYRLLYANVITSMETFLGDTLKREVLQDEETLRKFVETYKPFKNISMNLSDLYAKKESMPTFVKTTLRELLYHDLRRIKPIYHDALGIDLGNVSDLYKAVLVRHDLVHRNGKNHDGVEHCITEEMVRELQVKVQNMMNSVKNQVVEKQVEKISEGEEVPDIENIIS